jgi:molybdopterin/thiamine biosynthesis adenylyltransferase
MFLPYNIRMNKLLYSRNWLFLSKKDQKLLSTKKILLCGSGLGSFIAELLIRTGFTDITIADGDTVCLSNLNRQNYTIKDINQKKTKKLRLILKSINKRAKITAISKYLNATDLKKLIPKHDYVINTIDFDSDAFISCSNLCRKFKKTELFPTNLGFGGSVLILDKDCPTFEEYFKETDRLILKNKILNHLLEKAPDYMKKAFKIYKIKKNEFEPQLGISSFITAALVVSNLVKISKKTKTKTFPKCIVADFWKDYKS